MPQAIRNPKLTCILSHHPAKYLNVSMDMPMCVFSASVYTAPESKVSRVASSSLCASISSANLYMRVPRSRAFIRPHSPSSSALYRQKLSKCIMFITGVWSDCNILGLRINAFWIFTYLSSVCSEDKSDFSVSLHTTWFIFFNLH